MPELTFRITGAEADAHAAVPSLNFRLAICQDASPVTIQSIALHCQIRIQARQRRYEAAEAGRLTDLFGDPSRWSQTLHSMLWTHVDIAVPAFDERCEIDLPVPCSFDFNLSATKYFHGLDGGEVPLLLLFSGSIFYRGAQGELEMDLVSWNSEATFRLPVEAWRDMMDRYYPNKAWLCLNRRVFDALYEYKRRYGYTDFNKALAALLAETKREAS